MKLNLKATRCLIVTILIVIAFILYRVFLDVSYFIYIPLFLISITVGIFSVVYFQKTGRPVCKKCNHKMKLENKKLLNQDEEIRNGQFVFIYKYEYEYKCPTCQEVVHINKTVKK